MVRTSKMNKITKQKIQAKLLRLAMISKDRNDPPVDCTCDENDFWITHYAEIPDMDDDDINDYIDDMYDYLGTGLYERR